MASSFLRRILPKVTSPLTTLSLTSRIDGAQFSTVCGVCVGRQEFNFRHTVAMCPPDFFKVEYKINPCMKGDDPVNPEKAIKQWTNLKSAIQEAGVAVKLIQPQPDLPDMVFCCNAGILIENKVYLSKFRHPERQNEKIHFKRWFLENKYVVTESKEFFEGGGDAVYCPTTKTLWAGYGIRSDQKAYDRIQTLGEFQTIFCELIDENFYHLDTCFALITPRLALWYPEAFSEKSRVQIESQTICSLIYVPEEEAKRFICNSVAFGNTVITPPDCPMTNARLENWGFNVVEIHLSEFMKSGGACQCLVLKL